MKKKLIIIGGIIIAIVVVIIIFSDGEEATPVGGLARENFDSKSAGENGEFLRALKNLENVRLDGSILTSAAFQSLTDFSVELEPEPVGRVNPFKPINPLERSLGDFAASDVSGDAVEEEQQEQQDGPDAGEEE